MFSYETVDILAKLYGVVFAEDVRYSPASKIKQNFGKLIGKLGFRSEMVARAYDCDSVFRIKEFIFDIYFDKFHYENNPLTNATRLHYLKRLAGVVIQQLEGKFRENSPVFDDETDLFLSKLGADGYYLYRNEVLTNEELFYKHQAFFDDQTKKVIRLSEIADGVNDEFPSAETLINKTPLYKPFSLKNAQKLYIVNSLCNQTNSIDIYCVECAKNTTFTAIPKHLNVIKDISCNQVIDLSFRCSRNEHHTAEYFFKITNNSILKIGQFPSIADLQTDESKRYKKVLTKNRFKDFNRAIGLASHGVGVGSFVYLRRIFEDLIDEAYKEAIKSSDWVADYQLAFNENSVRVEEKILLLKDYLPEYLVSNRKIYGILSKGIHSLSEEECLEYYPVIRSGIELILDEKIAKKLQAEKIAENQKGIQTILSKQNK